MAWLGQCGITRAHLQKPFATPNQTSHTRCATDIVETSRGCPHPKIARLGPDVSGGPAAAQFGPTSLISTLPKLIVRLLGGRWNENRNGDVGLSVSPRERAGPGAV